MMNSYHEVDEILSSLRTDDPPLPREVKLQVVNELRTRDPKAVTAALAQALQDADPEYRCVVAWAFLAFEFAAAVEFVRPLLLEDAEDGVRGYLCEILGASGRREAVPLLAAALQHDADGTNRLVAARGLGHIGDPAALPVLHNAVQNDYGVDYEGRPVKKIAAEAIRRITEEKVASVA